MALTKAEREEFLSEPHVAALSVDHPGRGPLTVPIWYQYTPGGQPWVLTGLTSKKAELIRAAGRFTLMVERHDPTVRYVSVEGPVDRMVEETPDQLVEMSSRYLPPEAVDDYVAMARGSHGASYAVYMNPEHWLSADLGGPPS